MAEIRTVTTLRHKRSEILGSIENYRKRLAQAEAERACALRQKETCGVCATMPD